MTVSTYEPQQDLSEFNGSGVGRWVSILAPAAALSERIAGTEFVPAGMRNKPDVVCAAIMYGDELGLGPMQALQGIHVVEGRPSPSAELMRALIYRAGHRIEIVELTGRTCHLRGFRAGSSNGVDVVWTLDMAANAGLTSRNNWRNYPRAMLLARASSELARIAFPDVVKGLGHLADDDETTGEMDRWASDVATEDAPATTTIRRRQKPKPVQVERGTPRRDDDPVTAEQAFQTTPGARPVQDVPLPDFSPPDVVRTPSDLPPAPEAPSDAPDRPHPSGQTSGDGDASPALAPSPDVAPADPGGTIPVPDAETGDVPIGSNLMRAVHAGFRRIDCDDRTLRLRITQAIIERPITSSNELTRHEALNLVRVLSDLETGVARLDIDAEGNVNIYAQEPEV